MLIGASHLWNEGARSSRLAWIPHSEFDARDALVVRAAALFLDPLAGTSAVLRRSQTVGSLFVRMHKCVGAATQHRAPG